MNSEIREIWRFNQADEMVLIMESLSSFPFIAIDTEFPGCLRKTPMDASESERYDDMKYSVDRTKILQFGFTLFDSDCRIGGSWEVNFSGFRPTEDARNDNSIAFLRKNGLDFQKLRVCGAPAKKFFHDFLQILMVQEKLTWVTFHGTYDIAYLVKMLTRSPLPRTPEEFSLVVGKTIGHVFDLKAMAKEYPGLTDRMGLERLATEVGVSRVGSAHHAGSDSLLTAQAFIAMAAMGKELTPFRGLVYGLSSTIVSTRQVQNQSTPLKMAMMNDGCYGSQTYGSNVPPYYINTEGGVCVPVPVFSAVPVYMMIDDVAN